MTSQSNVVESLKSMCRDGIANHQHLNTTVSGYLDKRAQLMDARIIEQFGTRPRCSTPVCAVRWRKVHSKLPMQYATGGYPCPLSDFFVRMFRHFMRKGIGYNALYWAVEKWIRDRYEGALYFSRYNSDKGSLESLFRLETADYVH